MFKYTICEPLNPTVVDKGNVTEEEFRNILNSFPWLEMLHEVENANDNDICFSPTLELKDSTGKRSIAVSIVGPESELVYYIFYSRGKTVKKTKWFKKVDVYVPEFVTERLEQSEKDMTDAFNALLTADTEMLESRWG
jgi:hypothetical protein